MTQTQLAQHTRRLCFTIALSLLSLSFFFSSSSAFAASRSVSHVGTQQKPLEPDNHCGDKVEDLSQNGIIFAQSCINSQIPMTAHPSAILSFYNQTRLYAVTQWYACTATVRIYDTSQGPNQQTALFTKSFNCLSDAKQGRQQVKYDGGLFFLIPTFGHIYYSETQVEYNDAPDQDSGERQYIYPSSNAIPLYGGDSY